MKNLKTYIIPIIIIGIFVSIMNSGTFLKRPYNQEDDVVGYIDVVMENIVEEDWKQAENNLKQLKNAWNMVSKRVQFSVERNEMNMINTNIARLRGAILSKDKSAGIMELSEITEHWNDLEK